MHLERIEDLSLEELTCAHAADDGDHLVEHAIAEVAVFVVLARPRRDDDVVLDGHAEVDRRASWLVV